MAPGAGAGGGSGERAEGALATPALALLLHWLAADETKPEGELGSGAALARDQLSMAPALVSQVPQPNYSDMVVGPMGPIKARAPAHHTAARRPRAERLARAQVRYKRKAK